MLPSRGFSKSAPASALRNTRSVRIQTARPLQIPIRLFSQVRSQAIPLRRTRNISCAPTSSFGAQTAVAATASSVFSQRSGASRNLSLWPFSSKKEAPAETQAVPTPETVQLEPPAPIENSERIAEDSLASVASTPTPPDHSQHAFSDLDLMSVLDIPEQIGYLKNLGLEFGWGPSSMCEWVLEHTYIYTGMPWWATIAAVAAAWRVAMFWPTLAASRNSALLQQLESNPAYAKAKADFNEAMWKTRDRVAQMQAQEKMMRLRKESGASFTRMLATFLTVPFSFGMFRVLRGMAALPVPSFETGGLAWFTDLTVHDPYYILPVTSIALTAIMFKQTRAANIRKDPTTEGITNLMMYGLPPIVFLGTAWLPAGVQWFFLVLTTGSIVQTSATLNPTIRRLAGLPPIPTGAGPLTTAAATISPTWQAPTPPSQRLEGNAKDTASKGITESAKGLLGVDKQKEEWKKAQAYEERRAAEEKEKAYRRMEDLRRKKAEKGGF
ncbi:60Kd inner membrane protein-domain-containing protein [Daldinia sp. FL1419]|nr:60Kd inner membrane protein-domain-containing protein [Daldinia sp. FL1419]